MKHSSLVKFYLFVMWLAITFCGCKKNFESDSNPNISEGKYVTTAETYLWENGQWREEVKSTNGYDNDCHFISDLEMRLDSISGDWVNSALYTRTYNPNGTIATRTAQLWDLDSVSWVNDVLDTYTYQNGDTNYSTLLTQTWTNGQWQKESLSTATYDNNNHLVHVDTQLWDNNGNPIGSEETDNTYGSNGKINQSIITIPSSAITTYERYSYTYDSTGNLTTWLQEFALNSPSNWENEEITTYPYTADGQNGYIAQIWDPSNSTWVNGAKSVWHYSKSCH